MWYTSLLKNKLPFIKNETGTTEKYTDVVYVMIGNPAFCLSNWHTFSRRVTARWYRQ